MSNKSSLLDEISNLLMDCGLFEKFPPPEIGAAARYFSISEIGQDDVIFTEGESGSFMCIIVSGTVAVRKADSDGDDVELAKLQSGRAFGEMAVLDGERRSATCVAATDCVLLTLSRDSLDKLLLDLPRTGAKVIRALAVSLSRRLRMADGALVDHQI